MFTCTEWMPVNYTAAQPANGIVSYQPSQTRPYTSRPMAPNSFSLKLIWHLLCLGGALQLIKSVKLVCGLIVATIIIKKKGMTGNATLHNIKWIIGPDRGNMKYSKWQSGNKVVTKQQTHNPDINRVFCTTVHTVHVNLCRRRNIIMCLNKVTSCCYNLQHLRWSSAVTNLAGHDALKRCSDFHVLLFL